MVTFVLDASAILRFLDGEAGVARVKHIFRQALSGECNVIVSEVTADFDVLPATNDITIEFLPAKPLPLPSQTLCD